MNDTQRLLVRLISSTLRGRTSTVPAEENINWLELFREAEAHHVKPLLYPVIGALDIRNSLIEESRKEILSAVFRQTRHVNDVGNVLTSLQEKGISTLVLKGLALRELYPFPELRTMVDADILIHKEDTSHAVRLLTQMGYRIESTDPKNIHFRHKTCLPIELHFSLINSKYFKKTALLDELLWKDAIPFEVSGQNTLTLSWEDHILHALLHMAEHMLRYGFGLRMLCDLVLLVEKKEDVLNWSLLYGRIKAIGIEHFTYAVFMVCKRLFGLEIPKCLSCQALEDDPNIDALIKDIFSGGIFGYRNPVRNAGNSLLSYSQNEAPASSGRLKYVFSFLFPTPRKLGTRYAYAQKCPILLPLAWIHRLLHNLLHEGFKTIEKIKLSSSTASLSIFKERARLLNWLNLR